LGRGRSAEGRNVAQAKTGFNDETGEWYSLDNAATIMPAVSDAANTSLFRMSADIDEAVNLPALQKALESCARRFPYFCVELRRGFFWYYFQPSDSPIRVEADSLSPQQGFDPNRRGRPLFRVRARTNRIAVEFSHIIADGTGCMRFLKTLLVEYFRLRGTEAEGSDSEVYDLCTSPEADEFEDAYHRHFSENYPAPDPLPPAYHLRGRPLHKGEYRVIRGDLGLAEALAVAKNYGVTLTELVVAVYLDALQNIWLASDAKARRRRPLLAIEVPVNMRKFYQTKSNRNFSLFFMVYQDMRLGRRDFKNIVERTRYQFRLENEAPTIARQISRNVGGSRHILVRLVPLAIKDFFARLLFAALGENLVSGFISNLGAVGMPPGPATRVKRFDFIPAPSSVLGTNASMLSWRDRLYIDFGSRLESRELERLFFARLRGLGIPVRVECAFDEARLGHSGTVPRESLTGTVPREPLMGTVPREARR